MNWTRNWGAYLIVLVVAAVLWFGEQSYTHRNFVGYEDLESFSLSVLKAVGAMTDESTVKKQLAWLLVEQGAHLCGEGCVPDTESNMFPCAYDDEGVMYCFCFCDGEYKRYKSNGVDSRATVPPQHRQLAGN